MGAGGGGGGNCAILVKPRIKFLDQGTSRFYRDRIVTEQMAGTSRNVYVYGTTLT